MTKYHYMGTLLLMALLGNWVEATSLYQADNYRSLTDDAYDLQLGSNITVLIVETSSAETNTDTSINKGVSLTGSLDKDGDSVTGGLDASLERSGGGNTHRNGHLKAQVTVPVIKLDGSDRLFVSGSQSLVVNGEQQVISISGWVRRIDISSDNTVVSSRLSEASIEYVGYGVLDKNQKPGLISKFFSFIGLI